MTLQDAVLLTPPDDPERPGRMRNLADSFIEHFDRMGNVEYIENAISTLRDVLLLTPQSHPNRPEALVALEKAISARFKRTGIPSDIDETVLRLQEETKLMPEDHTDRDKILEALGNSLFGRFERLGEPSDITQCVLVLEECVKLRAENDMSRALALNNLGGALCRRFESSDVLEDINKSVLVLEDAVRLTQDRHPNKVQFLSNLGHSLRIRFDRFGDVGDINKSVSLFQDPIQHTPDDHSDKAFLLNNLASCLSARFRRLGILNDINDSILMHEESIRLTPDGFVDKPSRLSNLGICLLDRFARRGDLVDLDKASPILDKAVQLISDDHPERSSLVRNFGNALFRRFEKQGNLDDLNKFVSLFKLAVHLTPNTHPNKSSRLNNYAEALAMRVGRLRDIDDFKELFQLYSSSATSGIGPASDRFYAAGRLAHYTHYIQAEFQSDFALLSYGLALSLLPELAWLALSITDRHHQILTAGGLVRDALATAVAAGQYNQAMEWLEQGHPIIWGQLLNLRTPVLDGLKERHPDLADRFLFLSSELERATIRKTDSLMDSSRPRPSLPPRYHDYAEERNRLLTQIRALDGFDRFLLPKKMSELSAAAQTEDVLHVPLTKLTLKDAETLADSLATIVPGIGRNDRLYGKCEGSLGTEKQFEHILSELWLRIAKPVLNSLGMMTPFKSASRRIWWCPTGPLVFLPIHAAGLYGENEKFGSTLADYAISSYTPSLTALIQGFRPRLSGGLQLLAVAQPSASGQVYIPGTQKELDLIALRATGNIPLVRLQRDTATVTAVKEGMKKSNWGHFACHGVQDISDPTQNALLLAGSSRLTLSDIIQLSLPHADLAVLSACQTATGAKDLQEESVHLAAGMLLAGYRSVVATMWSIMDNDAPEVASDLYDHLFKISPPDPTRAAEALHLAVLNLRQKTGNKRSFFHWVPFIHVGV
ncbi:CHAT domain-containing protein [Mycena leptocephala]|nr:CHAT domain-containing protein [Mycena leptocephala]